MGSKQRRTTPKRGTNEKKKEEKRVVSPPVWLNEVIAVLFYALALFLLITLGGYALYERSPEFFQIRLLGRIGEGVGRWLLKSLGLSSLVLSAWCLLQAVRWWRDVPSERQTLKRSFWWTPIGLTGMTLSTAVVLAVLFGRDGGGAIGVGLEEPISEMFGAPLTLVFGVAATLLLLPLGLERSLSTLLDGTLTMGKEGGTLAFIRIPVGAFTVTRWISGGIWKGLESMFSFCLDPFLTTTEEAEEVLPKPRVRKNKVPASVTPEEQEEEPEIPEEQYSHVVVSRRTSAVTKSQTNRKPPAPTADYKLPGFDLLKRGESSHTSEDDDELVQLSRQIETKLKDFGIFGRITEVHPGPVVTLFEYEPAAGVKVGKITALQDDLALSLRALSVRIIAALPKKGTVGIEVPNRHRDIVRLRDLLESEQLSQAESILSVPIGKDTYGDPVVVDIASMPHLLIAGATGTGKSVCINSLLISLLYRATPQELGLILIDPKILELSIYENIPHLRVPVVTVPKQAKAVLSWAVKEMDRRYRLMKRFSVRNIDSYNRIVRGDEKPFQLQHQIELEVIHAAAAQIPEEGEEGQRTIIGEKLEPLSKIVIVIDELADLMLTVGKDIEELITRLAQKARAAGIHLILATQRPSVDVITGLIKANFPARLSFRVTSRIDSRTILDCMGAERLLGKGDMLFMAPGAEALKRVHGAFLTDDEVQTVVGAVRSQTPPQYDEGIMAICEKALLEDENESGDGSGNEGGGGEYDEFYDKAVELVVQKGQASTSMIQRAFRIGYNRAARIIELMEKEGVIGPMDGIKPREVLVQNTLGEG
jgi:DNA segregation ATPase FtsK/SpoIIIE-like protein